MGRRTLNTLPLTKPHCWRPGPHGLSKVLPTSDAEPEDLLELMADGLIANLASAQGIDMPPLDPLNYTHLPAPGRQLWNLLDMLNLEEVRNDPDLLDLNPFLSLALRPSTPKAPRITPRMAIHIAGLRISDVINLQRRLNDVGIIPSRPANAEAYLFFYSMGYGPAIDPKVDTLRAHLMPSPKYKGPKRNSKRTAVQQYLLDKERDYPPHQLGKLTLAQLTMRYPPTEVDLGPRLHALFDKACERLNRHVDRARRKGAPEHLRVYLDDIKEVDTHLIEHEVLKQYLCGDWNFQDLYSDHLSLNDYCVIALVRCMVQEHYTSALWRYQQPATLLTTSIGSGISPAVFVRSAIEQVERTGITYLGDSHPSSIADMIKTMPEGPPQAMRRRQDLIEELEALQVELTRAIDELPLALPEETRLAASGDNFPAWGLGDGLDDDD